MASLGKIRNLSPDFIRDVLPKLPPPISTSQSFNRAGADLSMARMKEGKDRALSEYWPHLRDNVSSETFKIAIRDGAEIDIRAYTPKAKSPLAGKRPVVYTLHGGGFVSGNIDAEDLINRQICSVCDVIVFSLDYRLAPEYPVVPTILNDVEDGLKWAYANAAKYGGDTTESIFISGTSSGGAMTATLGFRSKSLGIPIKGLICRQPVFIFNSYELGARPEWLPLLKSREENYDAPILNGGLVIPLNKLIGIPLEALHNPYDFPIFASKEELSRMPPTYFVQAPCDPCADEVELFKNLLTEAGVTVRATTYDGMPHGFHAHHILKAARDEMKDTAEAMKWLIELSRT